ncbi:MAG: YicC family protein [Flavobacteriales bacterium]|nr:YicC family protein [Flavobacteriales bacterium]
MIQSMTGFGKSEVTIDELQINVEVKSLNSKFLDLSLKLPSAFKNLDLSVRSFVKEYLKRGKIEVMIHYEKKEASKKIIINKDQLINYYNQLSEVSNELKLKINNDLIGYALKLPEVIQHKKNTVEEDSNGEILNAVKEACKDLNSFRKKEGNALNKELVKYVNSILESLKEINQYEKERLPKVRDKLKKAIDELNLKSQVDEKRLEQELIFYSEKLDLTEEKVRLKEHCNHFIDSTKELNSGKKLGFISQEIGREINTLGSKANNISIQKIVVGMKDELEKIKEQVLNVL